jgi:hypothetical protein
MPLQKFLIAPFKSGLVNELKPWLIPEDAFERLQNVYVWRGRVKKRIGSLPLFTATPATNPQLVSRLRINVGTTSGAGNLAGNVPGVTYAIGQMFSIGQQMWTVNAAGAPAAMLRSSGAGTGTYDTGTGAFVFAGAAATTDVYFYPATPVMGFPEFETTNINFERYLAFDTQFSYEFTTTGWERLALGTATWTGSDSDFFSSTMYRGATPDIDVLFAVNNTPTDGIRYFDGTTWFQLAQSYSTAANTSILGARIVVQFKGRLVLLNTYENDGTPATVQYPNRARFCQLGDPTQVDAWYQPPVAYGKGDFIDAPTQQQIISAQIFKDRLIVYFERSTWELVYTGNQILPFTWQNINIELGSESTFSLIQFDKGIVGIGDTGIHVCNGTNVERIDEKIPDDIYDIQNANAGVDRVYGIRDYDAELAYWAIPSVDEGTANLTYPNRLLVYNYVNNSWAYWDDSVTAFGYIQLSAEVQWEDIDDIEWAGWEAPWNSGRNQSRMRRVVAGNQEGYTFYMDKGITTNAGSLQITDIAIGAGNILTLTVQNHNILSGEFVFIDYVTGSVDMANLNDMIYEVINVTVHTFTIYAPTVAAGVYSGGGTVATVSQIDILTKQYNFFLNEARNVSLDQIDMLVTRTAESEITVDVVPSTGNTPTQSLTLETAPYGADFSPFEIYQDLLWHAIYPEVFGTYVQLHIYWTESQMMGIKTVDPTDTAIISRADFQMHAMVLYVQPTAYRLQ